MVSNTKKRRGIMRKLKRILSAVLATALCFTSLCAFADEAETKTAAASFSDIQGGTKLSEAVNELVVYGIISGYPDGTFKPEGQITRAEFAAVITRFKGLGSNLASDAVTGFADLDADEQNAWARPYVKAAIDAGIINGFEDGTFRAGDPVTYEQAVKMIICAIGYNVIADSEYKKLLITNPDTVTWSSGYIAAATKNNITLNASVADVLQPATREIVAMLAFNALDAPKINVVTDADGKVTYEKDNTSNRDDLSSQATKIEGVITANCYTALDEQQTGLNDNQIRVKTEDGEYTYTLGTALSDVDVEELLGRRLNVYVDGDTVTKLVYKNDTETVIEESQIDSISGDVITYRDENGRNMSVSISGYTFIYNGKYVSAPFSELTKSGGTYEFRNGYIKLLESGGEKLAKVTSFDVWVVNGFDKTNEKITFKYGKTVNGQSEYVFPTGTSAKPTIYVNGKLTAWDSLSMSQYAVINYVESVGSGKTLKKMYVTTGAKSGKVTSKTSNDREIELDGKTVYLTRDYDDYAGGTGNDEKPAFDLNDSFSSSLYYDYTGQLAAVKYSAVSLGKFNYGYLVGAGSVKENGSSVWKVRLVDSKGAEQTYTLKDSIKLDGTSTKGENAVNTLEDIAMTEFGMSSGCYQPIRYSLSGGKVESIDTVRTGSGAANDSLTELESSTLTTKVSSTTSLKKGSTTFSVSSSTVILSVPAAGDSPSDMSGYAKLTQSQAFSGKSTVDARVFDINSSTKSAGFIVVYGVKPTYLGSSSYMVITKRDGYGDKVRLNGYVNGSKEIKEGENGLLVSNDYKTDASSVEIAANEFTSDYLGGLLVTNPADLEKGDIVLYLTDGSGEIISMVLIYDASNPVQAQSLAAGDSPSTDKVDHSSHRYAGIYTSGVAEKFFHYGVPSIINSDEKKINLSFYIDTDNYADDDTKKATLEDIAYTIQYSCSGATIYELNSDKVSLIENFETMSASDALSDVPTRMLIVSASKGNSPAAKVIYIIR